MYSVFKTLYLIFSFLEFLNVVGKTVVTMKFWSKCVVASVFKRFTFVNACSFCMVCLRDKKIEAFSCSFLLCKNSLIIEEVRALSTQHLSFFSGSVFLWVKTLHINKNIYSKLFISQYLINKYSHGYCLPNNKDSMCTCPCF